MKITLPTHHNYSYTFNKSDVKRTAPQNSDSSYSKIIDKFFNLGYSGRQIIPLSTEAESDENVLKLVSNLLKRGIVGYEYLEINKKPYKSFISTRIGNFPLSKAKLYKKNNLPNTGIYV